MKTARSRTTRVKRANGEAGLSSLLPYIAVVSLDVQRRDRLAKRLQSCAAEVEVAASAAQAGHQRAKDLPMLILFAPFGSFAKNLVSLEAEFLSLYRLISPEVAVAALTTISPSLVLEIAHALGMPVIVDHPDLNLCRAVRDIVNQPRRASSIDSRAHAERRLSRREAAILVSLRAGLSLKQVAHNLGISPNTVSTYKSRVMAKLNRENNAQLLSESVHADGALRRE